MPRPPYLLTLVLAVKDLRVTAAVATLLVVLVACAAPVHQSTPSPVRPVSLEYDHRAGALVVEADTAGGLEPPPAGRHVAEVSIYGDGLMVMAAEGETPVVGTDRVVTVGHLEEEELDQLLAFVADVGFLSLDDRYMPSPAAPDTPWRQVTVNLIDASKTVSVYPFDYEDTPAAFSAVYEQILRIRPADAKLFTPTAGTLTATELGPIAELPAGQANQVAPWDTPLLSISLSEATEGAYLEGEHYGIVEGFLLRYPQGQIFGSQEGRAYQVLLEADLPWEEGGL
jgi:hypothetical protein